MAPGSSAGAATLSLASLKACVGVRQTTVDSRTTVPPQGVTAPLPWSPELGYWHEGDSDAALLGHRLSVHDIVNEWRRWRVRGMSDGVRTTC